jgi:hypothetical protein
VTTSFPVMSAGSYSASLQPSDTDPFAFRSVTTCSVDPSTTGMPFESCTVMVDPLASVSFAPGNAACESTAAAVIADAAEAGELVMYGAWPALPDAATTTMPARAALSAASESGKSGPPGPPKSAPSDMLMTCIPFSMAQSIPATMTSLEAEPAHPNTRTA